MKKSLQSLLLLLSTLFLMGVVPDQVIRVGLEGKQGFYFGILTLSEKGVAFEGVFSLPSTPSGSMKPAPYFELYLKDVKSISLSNEAESFLTIALVPASRYGDELEELAKLDSHDPKLVFRLFDQENLADSARIVKGYQNLHPEIVSRESQRQSDYSQARRLFPGRYFFYFIDDFISYNDDNQVKGRITFKKNSLEFRTNGEAVKNSWKKPYIKDDTFAFEIPYDDIDHVNFNANVGGYGCFDVFFNNRSRFIREHLELLTKDPQERRLKITFVVENQMGKMMYRLAQILDLPLH